MDVVLCRICTYIHIHRCWYCINVYQRGNICRCGYCINTSMGYTCIHMGWYVCLEYIQVCGMYIYTVYTQWPCTDSVQQYRYVCT